MNRKTDEKVDWLIKNKSLWEGFPQCWSDCMTSNEFKSRLFDIAYKMQEADLYRPSTHLNLIIAGVFENIRRARLKIRHGVWRFKEVKKIQMQLQREANAKKERLSEAGPFCCS